MTAGVGEPDQVGMAHGDLVFTQIHGPQNPITVLAAGYRGARVNHVGVVAGTEDGLSVLEAFPPGVHLTPLGDFLDRSADAAGRTRFLVARLRRPHLHLVSAAVEFGLSRLGVPYDSRFLPDDRELYCSELVIDMFEHANGGRPFFEEQPMSFVDPATGRFHQQWVDHYAGLGMAVPEGVLGSNPAALSRDPRLWVYRVEGDITGLESAP
jgi:uncharacterized protein YycO